MPKSTKRTKKSATHSKPTKKAAKSVAAPLLLAAPKATLRGWFRTRSTAATAAVARSWAAFRADTVRLATDIWAVLKPILRRAGELLAGTAAAAAILLVAFFAYSYAVAGRMLPHTEVAGVQIGLLTPEQAVERLKGDIAGLEVAGIPYTLDGKTLRLKPQADLDIAFMPDEIVARLYTDGRTGTFLDQHRQRLRALFSTGSVALPMRYDPAIVAARLKGRIPELAVQPVEPTVVWEKKVFAVTQGASARAPMFDEILAATETNIRTLDTRPIDIVLVVQQPRVTDAEAEIAAARATELLATPVKLTYVENARGGPWTIDLKKDPSWVAFVPVGPGMRVEIDAVRLHAYLTDTVAATIDQQKTDAKLTTAEEGTWRVNIEGEVADGHSLQQDVAFAKIQTALSTPAETEYVVELPATFEKGKVLDESGKDMGLRDMLAHAQTSFASSPAGRDFNVRKGMRIFNGILIPQGETFAFNSFLGPIDGRHGWKDALTIFNGGAETRMEPGGGICQVSTTVYQSAVLAGLEVVQRRPHSYFVSYYAKAPGLNGIDATVYPGSQDLVFTNDTPGPVLMLAGSRGNIAYVQLFGVKDRTVKLQGPMRYGSTAPPTEFEVDPTLPPGSTVVASTGHAGFSVKWNQTIVFDDGTEKKNTINSVYHAVPTKKLVAPPTTVAAN